MRTFSDKSSMGQVSRSYQGTKNHKSFALKGDVAFGPNRFRAEVLRYVSDEPRRRSRVSFEKTTARHILI